MVYQVWLCPQLITTLLAMLDLAFRCDAVYQPLEVSNPFKISMYPQLHRHFALGEFAVKY